MSTLFEFVRRLKGLPNSQPITLDGENCGHTFERVYGDGYGDGYGLGNGRGRGRGYEYGDGDAYGDGMTYLGTGAGNGVGDGTSVSEYDFGSANEYNK